MTRLLGSELFKLRSTRTFYGIVGGSLGLVLVIVILVTALVNFTPSDHPLTDIMNFAAFVQPFALVLGILAITSEFRHGTITPSLLVAPHRPRLVLAKLGASVAIGFALGLVTTVLVFLIVKGIGGLRDLDTSGDAGTLIIGGTIDTALWAALGLGVGSVLRNQVGAIVGSLVYLFVLENLLQIIPGLDDIIRKYGFGGVSSGLFGADDSSDLLGQLPAGLLFAAYAGIFVVAGILVIERRDVTA
ncbi:ABC transporter permease [Solirubrobacter ginsenosidimutans]|uniref:ABC transporter permease n=1 Tax=Solirubrobacter ginsenosidimutans TaxID=490573 RepID=A0A9X3MWT4_9ACTN|nr:ABC transporter permease subunit [Solirubrobacter ginsenosidimutans]MDA0164149.1 ABC transporter permease [Solirubrobacter ginsenosidimutans]